jgi:hypothetical protein
VYRYFVLRALFIVGSIFIGQSSEAVFAQTAATVQIYLVKQTDVCGGRVYEDHVPCPILEKADFDKLQSQHRIPSKPQQSSEIVASLTSSPNVQFVDDLVGDANQYVVHLDSYTDSEKEAVLVVFLWQNPIPGNVAISLVDRASGQRICWPDPKSRRSICSFERQPESFFLYHYALQFVSNTDLRIETTKPKSKFGFSQ